MISNNYSAEHGHSAGGVISLTTRSGTNDFHGSVFEFLRNSVLDARNFFARERPPLRLQPVRLCVGRADPQGQDALFRLLGAARSRYSSVTPLQTVPSEAQRQGDFSGLRNSAGNPILIYDPGHHGRPRRGSHFRATGFPPTASIRFLPPHSNTGRSEPRRHRHRRQQFQRQQQLRPGPEHLRRQSRPSVCD